MKPYYPGTYSVSDLFSDLLHFIYLSNQSFGSLSHSNFRYQSSWISNLASSNAGLTIPNGSKMELTQLSKARLVSSNSLDSDWTVIWSDFESHILPNVLSIGKSTKSRFVTFSEMSSFGKVFKISIDLEVHFVKWNPPSFKSFDTDKIVDTAVVKSLKESK